MCVARGLRWRTANGGGRQRRRAQRARRRRQRSLGDADWGGGVAAAGAFRPARTGAGVCGVCVCWCIGESVCRLLLSERIRGTESAVIRAAERALGGVPFTVCSVFEALATCAHSYVSGRHSAACKAKCGTCPFGRTWAAFRRQRRFGHAPYVAGLLRGPSHDNRDVCRT